MARPQTPVKWSSHWATESPTHMLMILRFWVTHETQDKGKIWMTPTPTTHNRTGPRNIPQLLQTWPQATFVRNRRKIEPKTPENCPNFYPLIVYIRWLGNWVTLHTKKEVKKRCYLNWKNFIWRTTCTRQKGILILTRGRWSWWLVQGSRYTCWSSLLSLKPLKDGRKTL